MAGKETDGWKENPQQKGGIQRERSLRAVLGKKPQPESLQVVTLSDEAKAKSKHQTISLIRPEPAPVTQGLSEAQILAYQQRLETEASRLVKVVSPLSKLNTQGKIITLIDSD